MKILYVFILWIISMAWLPLDAQNDGARREGVDGVRREGVSATLQDTPAVEISASEGVIRVKNAPVGSVLEVYSVVGIKVKEIEMKQPSGDYYVNLAKGYYIIRIGGTVRKVAIR